MKTVKHISKISCVAVVSIAALASSGCEKTTNTANPSSVASHTNAVISHQNNNDSFSDKNKVENRTKTSNGSKNNTLPSRYSKIIHLTFDDGPSPYSLKILTILKKYNIKATFFEIGQNVQTYPKISKELSNAGMLVENHSWKHDNLAHDSSSEIIADVSKTNAVIVKATGKKPIFMRPPYGSTSHRVNAAIKAAGDTPVLWTSDSLDWSRPGVQKIIHNVFSSGIHNGGIVLMHDGGGPRGETIEALPVVIEKLKNMGYSFELIGQ